MFACIVLFHCELLHSVTRTALLERAKWRTVCYVMHFSVFLSRNWRCYNFGLSSLIMIDAHTWLSIENLAGWGRTALPAFVLFYLLWRKQTVFIVFLFWETILALFLSLAVLCSLNPLNSTALPVFWQLNLPYFLVVLASCKVLTLNSQVSMWLAVTQEVPI